jgi:hypothetical protein
MQEESIPWTHAEDEQHLPNFFDIEQFDIYIFSS